MGIHAVSSGGTDNQTGEVAEKLRDLTTSVKDSVQDTVSRIKDSATDAYHRGKEGAESLEHKLEDVIKDNPLKAVLIAAGVGLLAGIIWKRS